MARCRFPPGGRKIRFAARIATCLAAFALPPGALQAGPTGSPLDPGRGGSVYRHVIGFAFWYPRGWKVQEHPEFLQLVPTGAAGSPGNPEEVYFLIGEKVSDEGITSAADPRVAQFLKDRGLELSEEKTRIVHIDEGFDFLGFNFRKYHGKLLIKPAKSRIAAAKEKVRGIFKAGVGLPQDALIRRLNPVIRG